MTRALLLAAMLRLADDGCGGASTEPPGQSSLDAGPKRPKPGDPCVSRRDCDDGVFCNGAEECLAGGCVSARNAACRASCGTVSCDESRAACVFSCVESGSCTRDEDCDDLRSCTDDVCSMGKCAHLPVDARCPGRGACGTGVCVGDAIADVTGCDARPDSAKCEPTEGCTIELRCAPLSASCETDRDCANDNLCDGKERCVAGRCEHGTTCAAKPCEHASCSTAGVGDPWCKVVALARCP